MWSAKLFVLSHLVVSVAAASDLVRDLSHLLSNRSSISTNASTAPRWSDFGAPRPAYVVHVGEELDVAKTIKYCNDHDLKFLAQSGGHGWADTFDLGEHGVLIDLRGLNSITFSQDRERATIGGGTINSELVEASLANSRQALNGGCNCVGVLGATLGGGLSRWMGHYGMPIDNVLSANIVTSTGQLIAASPSDSPDLFWAVLGAGPNFGVVTSIVMRTFPLIDNGIIWSGQLVFSGDKLRLLVEALESLVLTAEMAIFWGFSVLQDGPMISAQISYNSADPQEGRNAFRTLYNIGPDYEASALVEYNHINDGADVRCEDGGRKPIWLTGLRNLDYPTFQVIWDEFVAFVSSTGLNGTTILVECYSNDAQREIDNGSTSYAHRDINYYAMIRFEYDDEEFDSLARPFGSRIREFWRSTSGFDQQRTYINFAHGDESLAEIYGESLPQLRKLKQKWDPDMKFNQWFPIA